MSDVLRERMAQHFTATGAGPYWSFVFNSSPSGWHQGLDLGEVLNFIESQGCSVERVDRTVYEREDVSRAGAYYTILVHKLTGGAPSGTSGTTLIGTDSRNTSGSGPHVHALVQWVRQFFPNTHITWEGTMF